MPSCSGCRLNRRPTERLTTGTPKEDDDMADMTGQVALVTGGARGIGAAITQRLVNRGVKVAAGYSRDAASRGQGR
jgi:3-oxoacyl-ACP reductase-like protein